MTRRRRATPTIGTKLFLEETLVAEASLFLVSPLTGKVPHGGWTTLFNALLQRWVQEQKSKQEKAS